MWTAGDPLASNKAEPLLMNSRTPGTRSFMTFLVTSFLYSICAMEKYIAFECPTG